MTRFALFIFVFTFISCKSDRTEHLGDIEIIFHQNGGSSVFVGGDNFENQDARKLNNDGIALAKEKEFEKAKGKFLKGLEFEPENPTLLNNIGNTEHRLRNYHKAIYYFEKSLETSDSTYLNSSLNLGLLYWKDYEFEKSVNVLEFTLSNSKDRFEKAFAHLQLAKTYLDMNKCKKSELSYLQAESELSNISGFTKTLRDLKIEINNCVQHRL
ncbi:tetratricopeptide repeat protein [Spongiimicrobium sp. 2-473A-2-J]|uniref:tetratricopeptide repeat protein n=1 Tax=Eudoraea algarum TaxID=3417568 RepID=UPI003D360AF2